MYPTDYSNLVINWANRGSSLGPETVLVYSNASPQILYVAQPILSMSPIVGFTRVESTPAAGQYRVYWNTNQIQMGPIPFDTSIQVSYVTRGTNFDAGHINDIASAVNSMELTQGLNPQGSYPTVSARLAAMSAGSGAGNVVRIEQFQVATPSGAYQVSLAYSPSSNVSLVFRNAEILNPFSVGATPPEYQMLGNVINIDSTVNLEDQELITVIYFSL